MSVAGQHYLQAELAHDDKTGEIGKRNARLIVIPEPQAPGSSKPLRRHVFDVQESLARRVEDSFQESPRVAELESALAATAAEFVADERNYADVPSVVQISEVVE